METKTEKLERDLKYHRNLAWTNLGGVAVETLITVVSPPETFHPNLANLAGLSAAGVFAGFSKWQHGKQLAIERLLRGQEETEETTRALPVPSILPTPIPVD